MGDLNGSPDARDSALRSALERLVLLECRAPLNPGPTAGSSELELARWRSEAQRAEARAASAEAQRDRLFSRLIAAERTQASLEGESGGADLAAFIAELRAELGRLEHSRDAAEKERAELQQQLSEHERGQTPVTSVGAWAERLSDQGLLPRPGATLSELERDLVAGSNAERALLKGIVRDLALDRSSDDELLREAAADRLSALPPNLSAPVFAAALSRETAPAVLAKLVRGAGLTQVMSLAPLLVALRKHPDSRVRAAVVFAEVRLVRAPPADMWLKDLDPRVRRRAALAAVLRAPDEAQSILAALGEDADPGVRQAVASGAAALPEPPPTLLLRLAQDPEIRVRRAALRALSAPAMLAALPAADRRKALREVLRGDPAPQAVSAVQASEPVPKRVPEPTSEPIAEPTREPKAAAAPIAGPLDLDAIESELRSSLRGRTSEQLARLAGVNEQTLNRALRADERRFVLRGPRWFAT